MNGWMDRQSLFYITLLTDAWSPKNIRCTVLGFEKYFHNNATYYLLAAKPPNEDISFSSVGGYGPHVYYKHNAFTKNALQLYILLMKFWLLDCAR